jgi:hypothetical protein
VVVIGAALVWHFCCRSVGNPFAQEQRRADNDPCVREGLTKFKGAVTPLLPPDFKSPADEVVPQETKETSENAFIKFIPLIKAADSQRQDLTCHGYYLPFKIEDGKIQSYPGDNPPCRRSTLPTPSPSPSRPPSASPSRTPPQSIQDKRDPILEMAKSVGRLGIRRTGSTAYPSFWGTGFLVAPDVIMTACHVMDPIMRVEGGEQHLHLDGEELFINFKWQKKIGDVLADYDYQCPIKDVLTCSSRPGVDVALLSFDKAQCDPKDPLPDALILDTKEPHPTTQDIEKLNACAMGKGKDCMAMVAYADIDHPIDAPTNDVYKVYKDKTYGDFQFVMNDDVATVAECDKSDKSKVDIMMDIATTTVGESGGVLTYLDQLVTDKKLLIVSGMHTCCSAFFKYEQDEHPPASDTACARLSRTLDNQAISTWSVLQDRKLCRILRDHQAIFDPDVDCK